MGTVRDEFLPVTRRQDDAVPFLAVDDHQQPIGYIQYYVARDGRDDWWPDTPGAGVRGIDLFVADPDRLDQGWGTAMVKEFVKILLADATVAEIRVDPHPANLRAIRCFAKAGFKNTGPISTPNGPALMMVLAR